MEINENHNIVRNKNVIKGTTPNQLIQVPVQRDETVVQHAPTSFKQNKPLADECKYPLNHAFCKSSKNSMLQHDSSSRPNTALTPKARLKSTAVNACYTPSSLFRSIKPITPATTPNSARKGLSTTVSTDGVDDRKTEISNMTVAVRVRPFNELECTRASVTNVVQLRGTKELIIHTGTSADHSAGVTHTFSYDHVFSSCHPDKPEYATQEKVFVETALPLIDRAFEGYNACLFAYGQTGSGKSYSMMGIDTLDDHEGSLRYSEAGIIPRFCHELFRRINEQADRLQAEVEVSYFEIFNERIHDLLSVSNVETLCATGGGTTPLQRSALKVREHPIWGPYVVDLSVHSVNSYGALRNWLAVGSSQRATAATGMNEKSSRSHSIFNILLNISEIDRSTDKSVKDSEQIQKMRRSKISLVDLAGSERISASDANVNRLREGVSINKSLLTLGKVIAALSNSKKNSFVPYRESVLTWLLRENLGGNSKTVMLATISPSSLHIDETLATLRYACQARTIVNRVKVNESPHDKIIRELRAEVERLKSLRQEYDRQKRLSTCHLPPRKIIIETAADESEVESLRQQLEERERELHHAQKSSMVRLQEAEAHRKTETHFLNQKGLALQLSNDNKQACLINLAADPILSGTLFYILPPGIVRVGRFRNSESSNQAQIQLDGPLVAPYHCVIENDENKNLYITPKCTDFETFLNGELVHSRQRMFHGDRLVIGGSHYFRVSNTFCPRKFETKIVDFQSAHREILQKQEKKLRQELDEEKRLAFSQLQVERMENERNFKDKMDMLELEELKFKCHREILETERKAFEEKTSSTCTQVLFTPTHKSTLLEDINRIMEEPSEESLHKTQLMVKEATQRCKNFGLKLEFKQLQVLDEFGMFKTVVVILDKENKKKAEWPIARLGVWLDIVRDCDCDCVENIFSSVDIEWLPIESDIDDSINESLNSSKISLNLSVVKKGILKQPIPIFESTSLPDNTETNCFQSNDKAPSMSSKRMLTYDSKTNSPHFESSLHLTECKKNFSAIAALHIQEIRRSVMRLKKLCEYHNSGTLSNEPAEVNIRKSMPRLEAIIQEMSLSLDQENYNSLLLTSKSLNS